MKVAPLDRASSSNQINLNQIILISDCCGKRFEPYLLVFQRKGRPQNSGLLTSVIKALAVAGLMNSTALRSVSL